MSVFHPEVEAFLTRIKSRHERNARKAQAHKPFFAQATYDFHMKAVAELNSALQNGVLNERAQAHVGQALLDAHDQINELSEQLKETNSDEARKKLQAKLEKRQTTYGIMLGALRAREEKRKR